MVNSETNQQWATVTVASKVMIDGNRKLGGHGGVSF
jgi:hypothetical protein